MLFLGLDLGKLRDYTALVIVEKKGIGKMADLHVRHLQRWELGTSYPQIVTDVVNLLVRDELKNSPLMLGIDGTGVGVAVTDLFRLQPIKADLRFITITGGEAVTTEGDVMRVPKKELVGAVQIALQTAHLKISGVLPHARTLEKELKDFEVKITDSGHATFGAWREGAHDDLVLALAIATYLAKGRNDLSWLKFYPGAMAKEGKSRPASHVVSTSIGGGRPTTNLFPLKGK